MGAPPLFFVDKPRKEFSNGCDFKSNCLETSTIIGQKTYVVGGISEESTLTSGVRIFDESIDKWITPTVLGTKPELSEGHSAVVLNDDRILILKKGSTSDDFAWFLEVDTQYVRQQKKILGTEVVAWSKGERGNAETPIVISGPSGVGKGTLISMLMKEFPSMFGFSVSHTTRAPRGMEKDGVHYHFTSRSVMEEEIKDGKFLEFASVHGNIYGTSVEAVEVVANSGKRCILDIDVQGARSVRTSSVEAIFIFVCPPSMEELEERLRARGTETEEQILNRLRNARSEMEQGQTSGIFDCILCNDNLEECYESLKTLLGLHECVNVSAKTGMDPDHLEPFILFYRKLLKFGVSNSNSDSLPEKIDLPLDHSIRKIDQGVIINCSTQLEKVSNKLIVLDVSALKGGAPGRTRGLNIYAMESLLDGPNDD